MNDNNINNEVETNNTTVEPNTTEPVVETAPVVEEQPIQPTEPVMPVEPSATSTIPVQNVATPPIQPIESEPKKKKSILPVLIVIVVILAALCGAAYYFLGVNTNNPIYNFFFKNPTTKVEGEIKEFKYPFLGGKNYADKVYLQDGNLYVVPSKDSEVTVLDNAKEIDGQKTVKVMDNVKNVFLLPYDRGLHDIIVLTNDGKTYMVGNNKKYEPDETELKPLEIKELTNVKDVTYGDWSTLPRGDVEYYLINDKKQIVYTSHFDGYVFYEKRSRFDTTILTDGTEVKLKLIDTQRNDANNSTRVMFEVTINGEAINGIAELEVDEENYAYDNVNLLRVPICGENGNISVGENMCEL